MEIRQISELPRQTLEQLLASIPFYKTVKLQDFWQFEVLLKHSRIVSYTPGEAVLRSGERDSWLYFLLKGQLLVYVNNDVENAEAVNYITPGEVFGDLAMLIGEQRTATLIADPNCRRVMVFATDFTVFGELDDFSTITLATKLAYYRNTVHSLRWKLEVYRSKYPDTPLADNHHRVTMFTGVKDSCDELLSLHDQGVALAQLLIKWNEEFGALSLVEGGTINPKLIDGIQ